MKSKKIIFKTFEKNKRLDYFLVENLNISRSAIKKMINDNNIILNDCKIYKSGIILKRNDVINIIKKENRQEKNKRLINANLNIVYENQEIIIVNKPSGILTHSTKFHEFETLANIIKNYWNKIGNNSFEKNDIRQGICHRLDKYTEGLIIVGKNLKIQKKIMQMIKNNEIKREYKAILKGNLKFKKITVNCPIKRAKNNKIKMHVSNDYDAKNAITHFEVLEKNSEIAFVKCLLETGRTHQIRVHANYIHAPVLNDYLYGSKVCNDNYQQYLVADKISFNNPLTEEWIEVQIELPKEFKNYLKVFSNE